MLKISEKAVKMPASATRKLVPFAEKAEAQGTKIYKLNIGAPDIKSPDCALDAIKSYDKDHLSYSNSAGLIELRKGLAEKYYKGIGIDVDYKEIIINVAGSEGVNMALEVVCDEGDEVIVIEPYYTNYSTFAFMNNITFRSVHTDIKEGFKLPSFEEFEKVLTPKTKAILLSNPCNPTGKLFTKEEMLFLGEFCKKNDLFLLSDEVYREFCYTDEPHFSAMNLPGCEQNVILIDSVSKRYNLCGARVGCLVSHNKEVMAAAMKYAQARLCPPVLGQIASIGALDTTDEYFAAVKAEYIARRDTTVRMLNEIPGVYTPTPMGAFYVVAELPVDDAEKFATWMLTDFTFEGQTVQMTPVKSFYLTPGAGDKQVRIAYVLEVPKLEKAFKVLAEGLKAYPGRTI